MEPGRFGPDQVTVRCPFCDRLFLMTRPLFTSERERTACPACRSEARRNTEKMRREVRRD